MRKYQWEGKELSLPEIAEKTGVCYKLLYYRIAYKDNDIVEVVRSLQARQAQKEHCEDVADWWVDQLRLQQRAWQVCLAKGLD